MFATPSICPMLKQRAAASQATTKAVNKAIFQHDHGNLFINTKLVFAKLYVFTKILFDAGTWPSLSNAECKVVHT
eukprot:12382881-Karenia_brevis.AAC.1